MITKWTEIYNPGIKPGKMQLQNLIFWSNQNQFQQKSESHDNEWYFFVKFVFSVLSFFNRSDFFQQVQFFFHFFF